MVKEGQEKLNPIKSVLGLTALLFSLVSCSPKQEHAGHDHVNDHMNARSFDELVRQFESPERSAYQQPEKVIQLLGDIATDTIMDLGSGNGLLHVQNGHAKRLCHCSRCRSKVFVFY
jgi:hypothetical protein